MRRCEIRDAFIYGQYRAKRILNQRHDPTGVKLIVGGIRRIWDQEGVGSR